MDAYWQSELSLVFDKECPSLSPSWQMGVKLLCGGHEMSKRHVWACMHVLFNTCMDIAQVKSLSKERQTPKQMLTNTLLSTGEQKGVVIGQTQQFLRWCVCWNCTISAPVDGSVTHKSIQGALKTCMMAEHLCLRDTEGTQSVSLVFSRTKEDKGAERMETKSRVLSWQVKVTRCVILITYFLSGFISSNLWFDFYSIKRISI